MSRAELLIHSRSDSFLFFFLLPIRNALSLFFCFAYRVLVSKSLDRKDREVNCLGNTTLEKRIMRAKLNGFTPLNVPFLETTPYLLSQVSLYRVYTRCLPACLPACLPRIARCCFFLFFCWLNSRPRNSRITISD